MDAIDVTGVNGKGDLALRCQNLIKRCLNLAEDRDWMRRGKSPAVRLVGDDSPTSSSKHHLCVGWDQVPKLLEDISLSRPNVHANRLRRQSWCF